MQKHSMMDTLKVLSALILTVFSFHSCSNKDTTTDIEELWISNEESAHLFAPRAQKVALLISRDSTESLTARGFFMNNGEFRFEWGFAHVQYDSHAKRISILDIDSDTIILYLSVENEVLEGAIHLQDTTKKSIGFNRADKNLEIRLFHPRLPDENGQFDYRYCKPVQIDDGLKTASIYRYASDSSSLSNLMHDIIDQKYGSIKSLLILKNNELVVEEYFYGYSRNEPQQIRSCTKSITSILLGIALDRHEGVNTNQSIFAFFPEYDSLKTEGREKITLEHVLTMMSGFQWDDIPGEMFEADDCFQFILSRPLETEPGEKFNYNSGCSILLGGVIGYLEQSETRVFAENSLFMPLGITKYFWETHKDGTLLCGSGLSLRPRDMAKIGLLVLNDGIWQNKQIVSKEWIRESTRPHVQESDFYDYGYQWWHHSRNNLQWWKEPNTVSPEQHDLIQAMGHGGQYIMIIRDLNLVIVTTASDFEDGGMAFSKIPMAIEKIIPIFEVESF
jgi:CubicO group peptidase (beta-lactamase class C family)